MTRNQKAALLLVALTAASASAPALAQHGHFYGPRVHFGFAFGPGYWGTPYYPYPPAYYYPPTVVVPTQPPAYIERSEPAPSQQDYWYYCADAKAYYPYVKDCPGGWQRVAPRPG